MNFEQMMLQQAYLNVKGLGDRLALMKDIIDWERFRPMIASVFHDDDKVGGRPHTDELVIARILALQSMYNLSDQELEFQVNDRLSFQNFVGFPDKVPDYSTVWKIRDKLQVNGIDSQIWKDMQLQIIEKGYTFEKGVIQDATFIDARVGRKRYYREKKAKKQGKTIEYTPKQLAHIDRDGTFAVKGKEVHYGYKDHIKMDVDHHLIRSIETTTASLHDGKIDLIEQDDIAAYRDKGYFGTPVPYGVADKTMQRAVRGYKLNGGQLKRNHAISVIRAVGERPFSVIKYVFHAGYTYIKTLPRVAIKELFKALAYNLYQLVTLKRKTLAAALQNG